jgi:hypothetical protein
VSTLPVERKLAAIFAADIAGYSRLMARDEHGTLARLKACRVIIDGLIATHRGRIFNTAGDGVVADFASAVDAVACAVAVQNAIATEERGSAAGEPMRLRNRAIRKTTNSQFSATPLRNYPGGTASATITLPIATEGSNQPKLTLLKSIPIEIRSEALAAMIFVLVAAEKSSRIAACVDDNPTIWQQARHTSAG